MKLFILGALGYPVLELAWRGRTHCSMALAGGLSMLLIGRIRRCPLSVPAKALLCGVGITGIEYICGRIWNKDYQIWDYRNTPLNIQGQICLPYTLLWCALSAGAMAVLTQNEKHNTHKQPDS